MGRDFKELKSLIKKTPLNIDQCIDLIVVLRMKLDGVVNKMIRDVENERRG